MLSATIPIYEPEEEDDPELMPAQELESLASLGDFLKLPKKQ